MWQRNLSILEVNRHNKESCIQTYNRAKKNISIFDIGVTTNLSSVCFLKDAYVESFKIL